MYRRTCGIAVFGSMTAVLCVAPAKAAAQQPPARRAPVLARSERAFPTGDRATSAVLAERIAPAEVRAGEEFGYELRFTNLTRVNLDDLLLSEQFPPTFKRRSITPEPTRSEGDRAVWQLKSLPAGATHTVQIRGSAQQVQDLTWCVGVTFSSAACSTVKVVQPRLSLTKTMPPEVILCDDIPMKFVVTNSGSGVAPGVRVSETLPAGLLLADGKNAFIFDAGDLATGQAKEFTVAARASRTGEFRNTAKATEDGGGSVEAVASVLVRQPVLAVTKRGPELRYLGRPAEFEINVRNTGDAPARDTVLVDTVPGGLEFSSADSNGQFSAGRVSWSLGTIQPGEGRTVKVVLMPRQRDLVENTATARAYCAEASTTARMEIRGVPAILLEVGDVEDPIEVGENETYEITVTNQGSADDTNIVIECSLPPEMEYVSSTGPTQAVVQGQSVKFPPVPALGPKAKVVYKVVCKGTKEADVRFKVVLDSDVIDPPVLETESTHIY
jgi:uncharacterized repeat protein (TIGR01451 family)